MIESLVQMPVTARSHPFCTAVKKCGLAEAGYIEEEYKMTGRANVYGWVNEKKAVVYPDAPYVNRLIVRKPADKARFSGNIVVEILNSTSFIDFDRVWALTYRHMLRTGDLYIGITSKPNVFCAMRKVDNERYRDLRWPNPAPIQTLEPDKLGNMAGASSPESEDGLFWDMLTDLARLLRDEKRSPVGEYGGHFQYLAGWSQSGAYMIRFLNDFVEDTPGSQPPFDGYFSAGSASSCMPDLNQSYGATAMESSRKLKNVPAPFIEMHTESENMGWGNAQARGENGGFYRIYDVAGASHDSKSTMIDYFLDDRDVFFSGVIPNYPGKEIFPTDYPYELPFSAALEWLCRWVRYGTEPPVAPRIETDAQGRNRTDGDGNVLGGLRLPFMDNPVCRYCAVCTPMRPDFAFASAMFGHLEYFPTADVVKRYGSLAAYRATMEREADRCVKMRLLLPEDRDACVQYAVEKAATAGLE